MFGSIGARVASQTERPVIAVVAPQAEFERLAAARDQLAEALGDRRWSKLVGYSPEARSRGAAEAAAREPQVRRFAPS